MQQCEVQVVLWQLLWWDKHHKCIVELITKDQEVGGSCSHWSLTRTVSLNSTRFSFSSSDYCSSRCENNWQPWQLYASKESQAHSPRILIAPILAGNGPNLTLCPGEISWERSLRRFKGATTGARTQLEPGAWCQNWSMASLMGRYKR